MRQSQLKVVYQGADITKELGVKTWTFTDNLSGSSDELRITVSDINNLWSNDWMPEEGTPLYATIVRTDWDDINGKSDKLDLGRFDIDEISGDGPVSTVTISCLSVPQNTSLRGEKKDRAWEKTKLSVIARDLANGAKLKLFYDTSDDPEYDRIDQAGENDLTFLLRMCNDAGLCLKVTNASLVIFDEVKYEGAPPAATITKGDKNIKEYTWRRSLSGLYRSCRVEYSEALTGETFRYTYTAPQPPNTARILKINERVQSVQEAERLARKKLREANRDGQVFNVTLIGDIGYLAGLTINVKGFGKADGKYIITKAVHNKSGGYTTRLDMRKVLVGY